MESNLLERLLQPQVVGSLIPIVAIIAGFWYGAVRARSRNALKQSMVERGMSAEEIERVLKA